MTEKSVMPNGPVELSEAYTKTNGRHPLAGYHGLACQYCHGPMLFGTARFPTRDHIIPRVFGGPSSKRNIAIVCRPCNNDKAARSLEQFVNWLRGRADPRADIVEELMYQRGNKRR